MTFARLLEKYSFRARTSQIAFLRNTKAHKSASNLNQKGSEIHQTPQRMQQPVISGGFVFVGLRTLGVLGGRRVADMNMVFYILV